MLRFLGLLHFLSEQLRAYGGMNVHSKLPCAKKRQITVSFAININVTAAEMFFVHSLLRLPATQLVKQIVTDYDITVA